MNRTIGLHGISRREVRLVSLCHFVLLVTFFGPLAAQQDGGCPQPSAPLATVIQLSESMTFRDDTCDADRFDNILYSYRGPSCTLQDIDYKGREAVYELLLNEDNEVGFQLDVESGDLALILVEDCSDGQTCISNSSDLIGSRNESIQVVGYPAGRYYLIIDSAKEDEEQPCGEYTLTISGQNMAPNLVLELLERPPESVLAGRNLSFSLGVRNEGSLTAPQVVVTSHFPRKPNGVEFAEEFSSPMCEEAGPGIVECALGDLEPGPDTSLDVVIGMEISPSAKGLILYEAHVRNDVETFESPQGNATMRSETVIQGKADLMLSASASRRVTAGDDLIYTFSIDNNLGPSDAEDVSLTVRALPGEIVEYPAACTVAAARSVDCDYGVLKAGEETGDQRIVVHIDPAEQAVEKIARFEVVSPTEADQALPQDREEEVRTDIQRMATLDLDESVIPADVTAGEMLDFAFTISNNGPSSATDVVLDIFLPLEVEVPEDELEEGCMAVRRQETEGGTDVSCQVGAIAPDRGSSTKALRGIVSPDARDEVVTEIRVSSKESPELVRPETIVVNAAVNVAISPSILPERVIEGGQLRFTAALTNTGPSTARGATLNVSFPRGSRLLAGPECTISEDGVVQCEIGELLDEAMKTIDFILQLPEAGVDFSETAVVTVDDPESRFSSGELPLEITRQGDLFLEHSDLGEEPILAGQPVIYRILLRNDGGADEEITMIDLLPAGVEFFEVRAVPSAATVDCGDVVNDELSCAFTLGPGDLVLLDIQVEIGPGVRGFLINRLSVRTPSRELESIETTEVVGAADLQISQSAFPDPVLAGSRLTYRIDLLNEGPSDAFDVVVAQTLPAAVTLWEAPDVCRLGGEEGDVLTCEMAVLGAGGRVDGQISVLVDQDARGTLMNVVSVSSAETDNFPGNNLVAGIVTVTARPLLKLDSDDPIVAGNRLVYTLTVTNNGTETAENVVVTEALPGDVGAIETSGCVEPIGVPTCTLGSIPANEARSFTVTVTPDGGSSRTLINTATVTSTTAGVFGDSPTQSFQTTRVTIPDTADLVLEVEAPRDPVVIGDAVTYLFTIRNNGPLPAADTVLRLNLPPGISLVRSEGCAEDPAGVPLGEMPPDSSGEVSLTIIVGPEVRDSVIWQPRLSSATELGNPDEAAATVEVRLQPEGTADLVLSQRSEPEIAIAGEPLSLLLTVENLGPDTALGLTLVDILPKPVAFMSAPDGCRYDSLLGTVTCELAELEAGRSHELRIEVRVLPQAVEKIINRVEVHAETADDDRDNNSSSTTIQVEPPSPP